MAKRKKGENGEVGGGELNAARNSARRGVWLDLGVIIDPASYAEVAKIVNAKPSEIKDAVVERAVAVLIANSGTIDPLMIGKQIAAARVAAIEHRMMKAAEGVASDA